MKNNFQNKSALDPFNVRVFRENSQYFSSVVANPATSKNFIANILKIIKEYNLDGADIDWEYPVKGGDKDGTPVLCF